MGSFAWKLLNTSFQNAIQFRLEILIWLILDLVPAMVILLVWGAMFVGNQTLKGLTIEDLVTYYLIIQFLSTTTQTHFINFRTEQIRRGAMSTYLLRPVSYIKFVWWQTVGGKLFQILTTLPLFMVMGWIANQKFGAHLSLSWSALPSLGILMIFGFIFDFLLSYIIVLTVFWLDEAEALEHFKWMAVTIFGGVVIPIQAMPVWLRNIIEILPFQYLYIVPAQIVQSKRLLVRNDLYYMVAVIIVLFFSGQLIFKKAIKNYTASGG